MNKLLAACAVATAGLLAGPTAVAGAADIKFENGHCEVYGTATFDSPLTGQPAENGYHFLSSILRSGPNANKKTVCSGKLNDVPIQDVTVSAKVDGKGTLSCGSSQATGSPGTLNFLGTGQILGFTLDIVGFGTEVALVINGEKSGRGHGQATFRDDPDAAPDKAVQTCAASGFTALDFAATVEGDEPLVSANKAPTTTGGGGGGSGGGGGTTGGGGGGGTTGGGGGGTTGTTQSVVTLRALAQKLKAAFARGIGVTLRGNVPAKATLQAQIDAATAKRYGIAKSSAKKPITIGKGTINLKRSGQTTGYVKLSSTAKRKLRNARRLKVKIVGTILDVTQRKQKVSKTVTLKK